MKSENGPCFEYIHATGGITLAHIFHVEIINQLRVGKVLEIYVYCGNIIIVHDFM